MQVIVKLATIFQESIDFSQTGKWIKAAVEEYKIFANIDNYLHGVPFKKLMRTLLPPGTNILLNGRITATKTRNRSN